jgi:hypothetical protein
MKPDAMAHARSLEIVDTSATVANETSPRLPSREEIEKVARRRYQNPEPFVEGRFWWVLIRQDDVVNGKRTRRKKRVKLAPAETPETEVCIRCPH